MTAMKGRGPVNYGRRRTDLPGVVPVDMAKIRKARLFDYALANSFEAIIAVAAIVSGLGFFLSPQSLRASPIGQQLDNPVDDLWSAMYLLAGVCIIAGLLFHGRRWSIPHDGEITGTGLEVMGLVFLATSAAANTATIVIVSQFTASVVTYAAVVLASLVRIRALVSAPTAAIPVEVPGGTT